VVFRDETLLVDGNAIEAVQIRDDPAVEAVGDALPLVGFAE
jgi:hypothetical protein